MKTPASIPFRWATLGQIALGLGWMGSMASPATARGEPVKIVLDASESSEPAAATPQQTSELPLDVWDLGAASDLCLEILDPGTPPLAAIALPNAAPDSVAISSITKYSSTIPALPGVKLATGYTSNPEAASSASRNEGYIAVQPNPMSLPLPTRLLDQPRLR